MNTTEFLKQVKELENKLHNQELTFKQFEEKLNKLFEEKPL